MLLGDRTAMSPYGTDGVGVTLIRWMLSLTPEQRLAVLQDFTDFVWEMQIANTIEPEPLDLAGTAMEF